MSIRGVKEDYRISHWQDALTRAHEAWRATDLCDYGKTFRRAISNQPTIARVLAERMNRNYDDPAALEKDFSLMFGPGGARIHADRLRELGKQISAEAKDEPDAPAGLPAALEHAYEALASAVDATFGRVSDFRQIVVAAHMSAHDDDPEHHIIAGQKWDNSWVLIEYSDQP